MQKQALAFGFSLYLVLLNPLGAISAADLTLRGDIPVQVYFSPDGGCTDAILKSISRARKEILIQAYSFLSPSMAQALITAHKSGVKVELIIDKSERQEGLTPSTLMANAGISVYLDGKHAVANNRLLIIDEHTVITGSFNFNKASEELNAENLLILKSKELSMVYRNNWLEHRKHAEPF